MAAAVQTAIQWMISLMLLKKHKISAISKIPNISFWIPDLKYFNLEVLARLCDVLRVLFLSSATALSQELYTDKKKKRKKNVSVIKCI